MGIAVTKYSILLLFIAPRQGNKQSRYTSVGSGNLGTALQEYIPTLHSGYILESDISSTTHRTLIILVGEFYN